LIEVNGYTFTGAIKLFWPIAAKIAELSKPQIEKKLLCGVTDYYTEYKKMPDPSKDQISHIVYDVKALEPDVIEVSGAFLATTKGEGILKMYKDKPELQKRTKVCPNMYGIAAKKADGSPDIQKETVCTIDLIIGPDK
jgi:hypothetical protein